MATKKALKLPMPKAAPAPRTTLPKTPGAADLDATMVGRANRVQPPKSNVPPGRKGKR